MHARTAAASASASSILLKFAPDLSFSIRCLSALSSSLPLLRVCVCGVQQPCVVRRHQGRRHVPWPVCHDNVRPPRSRTPALTPPPPPSPSSHQPPSSPSPRPHDQRWTPPLPPRTLQIQAANAIHTHMTYRRPRAPAAPTRALGTHLQDLPLQVPRRGRRRHRRAPLRTHRH